jgi:hypothetical protein
MMIIGCDFHTRYQQIAMLDEATGELTERRLEHENGEAHAFYRDCRVHRTKSFTVAGFALFCLAHA